MNIKRILVSFCFAMAAACTQSSENVSANSETSEELMDTAVNQSSSEDKLLLPACQPPLVAPKTSASQADFDVYSWQTFIALNWPASSTERGQPDCSKSISDSGLRVWQTYKNPQQVFLTNAANPGNWNDGYPSSNSKAIMQIAKASAGVAIKADQEAVGGWLIDQNKNPTYFQIWVDENWYNYVLSNAFYNKDNFSNQTRIDLPDQSKEIKSAWRILSSADDKSKYITQDSTVAEFNDKGEPTGTSKSVTLGLVGLHIIIKAPGYPQWIWATFEHIDNVPPSEFDSTTNKVVSKPKSGVTYSYYNANATNPNQSPCKASAPSDCQPFTKATPLTRVTPIRDSAKGVNQKYQSGNLVKGTVLENYQLITTQWPTQPNNPAVTNGDPSPTIAANTTMESYIQSSSNCMNCHGAAALPGLQAKADYSFLFYSAQSANNN